MEKNKIEDINNLIKIHQTWKAQPRPTQKELLEEFPEVRDYLVIKLQAYDKEEEALAQKIKDRLLELSQAKYDIITGWICRDIIEIWLMERLNFLNKEIRKLRFLLYPPTETTDKITEEMIQRARDFPFNQLIMEERKDWALCPFHVEKTPSFFIKGNFAHCFGCSWSGDTIKFIMQKDNLTFPEAVSRLQ